MQYLPLYPSFNVALKRQLWLLLMLLCCLCVPGISLAEKNTIQSTELSTQNNITRFTIHTQKEPQFSLFTLENPDRIVIDLKNTNNTRIADPSKKSNIITSIRTALKESGNFRIVLDSASKPVSAKADAAKASDGKGYRLEITISHAPSNFEEMIEMALQDTTPIPSPNPTSAATAPVTPIPKARPAAPYKPVIIIDAGHGGHDPGSIGRRGTKEKTLTLAVALELHRQLKATGNYRPILTRASDIYIPLRGRVDIARKQKADLFISLHADSHSNPHVKGMSVYSLSDTASDKEAAALARKENKEDIITGIDLQHEDRDITNVLISIAQRDTMNQSAAFAEKIVHSAQRDITMLGNPHRFAGFRVLTAADVPSVLIEMGYLSNHREEKLLTTEKHKQKLVQSIIQAIDAHFGTNLL